MTDTDARTSLLSVVADLRAEGDELYQLLGEMDTGFWTQVSTFKAWTVWDVIAHLHLSDHMALTSLRSSDDFKQLMRDMGKAGSMRAYTNAWLTEDGHSINGPELLIRFAWAGPGMKARMFATARQMETWAHGWEIYDLMKVERPHSDRLQNIVAIGVRTFGWSFSNRKLPVPEPAPYVELTAPSGKLWTFNEIDENNCVRGSAVDFCQVVTQVRNIADTQLQVSGDTANAWMAIAQCFAGPPEDPPAPGTRSTLP